MINSPLVKELFALALKEDLFLGDITTSITINPEIRANAFLRAKQSLTVCGLVIIPELIEIAGMKITTTILKTEGESAERGETLVSMEGSAAELLSIERTLLNIVQRMSAIATRTKYCTQRLKKLSVLDTRKTAPGFRLLDKYAVTVGGGKNHRACLGDMVLVKNNHVDCQEGSTRGQRMRAALTKVIVKKPPYMSFEVEVRDFEEIKAALEFKPHVIMLDNFAFEDIPKALNEIRKASPYTLVEVSGGITPERCLMLDEIGVDFVSMGALTHSVEAVDISLAIEI